MKKLVKWTGRIALLLGVAAGGFYAWLHTSLPQTTGKVDVKTVSGQAVTIARDDNAVPHISGQSWNDIYFGIGFAHAQDRLWQLEMNRRIGSGRLAEVVGEPGLRTDRFFRTLGFRKVAESAYEKMPADDKAALQAYADGVNAFIDQQGSLSAMPPEFIILEVEPEPWTPVDSIIWGKMMWLSLSGNYRTELARARLMTRLSPQQVAQLYPAYPGDSDSPLPDLSALLKDLPLDKLAAYVGDEKPAGYGSNNWVISGDHTKSGKPILANDPHVGLTTPSVWYLLRLHNSSTGENVVGVSFPGSPSVVLGRNNDIAWGFTNTAPDIQDLYIEKLVGDDEYLTPTGPKKFITRQEVITVKDAEPVTLTVRKTRHGPVMTDILDPKQSVTPKGHVLALQWTALWDYDTQIKASLGLMQAKNYADMKAKAGVYMGPQQNMIYADTKGNTGYFAPAMVPVRHKDNAIKGRLPSPGWDAKYDWQGFIPVPDLPQHYNKQDGVFVTANEKIVGDDYAPFITRDWSLPYRGNRIRHLLSQRTDHDLETMKAIQMDVQSDMAQDLAMILPARAEGDLAPVLEALKQWDHVMDKTRPEPLIFDTWLRKYSLAVMADELGNMTGNALRKRPYFLKNVYVADRDGPAKKADSAPYFALPVVADESLSQWCDNVTTEQRERCADLSMQAFADTVNSLTKAYGPRWQDWQWGDSHTLTQQHRPLGQAPVISSFFQLSAPQSGGTFTVNVAGNSWRDMDLNDSSFGPSYRGLFDLSNLDNSLYIITTGQSGNPLSSHFGDQFPKWMGGDYIKIPTDKAIPDGADVLILSRD